MAPGRTVVGRAPATPTAPVRWQPLVPQALPPAPQPMAQTVAQVMAHRVAQTAMRTVPVQEARDQSLALAERPTVLNSLRPVAHQAPRGAIPRPAVESRQAAIPTAHS